MKKISLSVVIMILTGSRSSKMNRMTSRMELVREKGVRTSALSARCCINLHNASDLILRAAIIYKKLECVFSLFYGGYTPITPP